MLKYTLKVYERGKLINTIQAKIVGPAKGIDENGNEYVEHNVIEYIDENDEVQHLNINNMIHVEGVDNETGQEVI